MNKSDIGKPVMLALVDMDGSMHPVHMGAWYRETEEGVLVDSLPGGWIRMSEVVAVVFPARPQEALLPDAHKALDGLEREAYKRLQITLDSIKDRRAQLLEITYQPTQEESVAEVLEGEAPVPYACNICDDTGRIKHPTFPPGSSNIGDPCSCAAADDYPF